MIKQKYISIDFVLFSLLVNYFDEHSDYTDPNYSIIHSLISKKIEALYRHEVYTTYKTDISSTVRSLARQEYLRLVGINESFMWTDDLDLNVNH